MYNIPTDIYMLQCVAVQETHLRGGNRAVGVTHLSPCNEATLHHEVRFATKFLRSQLYTHCIK